MVFSQVSGDQSTGTHRPHYAVHSYWNYPLWSFVFSYRKQMGVDLFIMRAINIFPNSEFRGVNGSENDHSHLIMSNGMIWYGRLPPVPIFFVGSMSLVSSEFGIWIYTNHLPIKLSTLPLLLQHSLLPGGIILQGVLLFQGSMSIFACHYG
jgi:hypothetical protein